jgi:hypothetical protein
MSDAISFVLHAPADEAYAASLAGELGALTLKLEPGRASSLQFGAGVVCIVVWNDALACQSDALLCALTSGVVMVARRADDLPAAWNAFDAIDAREPAADAAALAAIISTRRVAAFDRAAQLQGAQGARQPLAARSAYGMAATLAVASLVTPFIMDRAQATDAGGIAPPSAPAQGAGFLRASLAGMAAQDAEATVQTGTPALDRWLAPDEEDAAPVMIAYTRDAAMLDLTLASLPEHALADPKVQPVHVAVENGGKPVELVLMPLNAAKNI